MLQQQIIFLFFFLGFCESTECRISLMENGKQNYVKRVSSKSMKNINGDIISESKGFEKNSNGLEKMAFQRRMNDKYHMIGQKRNNKNESWNKHQHLIGLSDKPDEIQQFHKSFNKKAEIGYKKNNRKKYYTFKQLI